MSFIIKGIDIPTKDKAPLQFTVWSDGTVYCRDVIEKIETATAVQIPKGHGRLIDGNTIIKAELYDSENGTYIEKEMTIEQWFMFMKNDAPTILKGEE